MQSAPERAANANLSEYADAAHRRLSATGKMNFRSSLQRAKEFFFCLISSIAMEDDGGQTER
jgi:hypothetical protein